MIAAGFIAQGARVYISSRKAAACEETAAELSSFRAKLLARAYCQRELRLDILVNNAGAAWLAEFDASPEKGRDHGPQCSKSPFFLTQALAESLRNAASKEKPPKVINVASIDGVRPNPQETYSYQASKAALMHMTRRLAAKLIGENIVVSAIAPGAFASEMNIDARDQADEVAARIPPGVLASARTRPGSRSILPRAPATMSWASNNRGWGRCVCQRLYLKQWRQPLGVNDASTVRQPQIQSDEMPVDA